MRPFTRTPMRESWTEMTLQRALAAAATLLSLAFACSTFERWLDRRRRHDLAWTASLAMFAVGSAALWVGASVGWDPVSFRVFYLFGAILNVPFLALGTIYLLAGQRRGDAWAVIVSLAAAFAAGTVVAAPLVADVSVTELPRGSEVFGPLPRILAAVASGAGALVVFAGAVLSAWRLGRGRGRPGTQGPAPDLSRRRLAGANVLIATGTAVLSAGGLLNSVVDEMTGFAVTLVAGVAIIFAGFLLATGGGPSPSPRALTPATTATATRGGAPSRPGPPAARRRT